MSAERGERLRALREACELTQEELARRSRVNRSTLAKVETGAHKLSAGRTRSRLAHAFSVTVDRLSDYAAGRVTLAELGYVAPQDVAAPPPARPRGFEHDVVHVGPNRDDHGYVTGPDFASLRAEMASQSGDGWELVSATRDETGGFTLFWKRPARSDADGNAAARADGPEGDDDGRRGG